MQVNNQPSFKAVTFTPRAIKALNRRMPSGTFKAEKDEFIQTYADSPLEILVNTVGDSIRLCAKIKEINPANKFNVVQDYMEESILSSMFCSPSRFMSKLCKNIEEKEMMILG